MTGPAMSASAECRSPIWACRTGPLPWARAELVRQGSDLTIIAIGTAVHRAAAAADLLAQDGIGARVLNHATLWQLDEAALAAAAATGALVTVEEAHVCRWPGRRRGEWCADHAPTPIERIGFPGFLPTGSVEDLFADHGLTPQGIAAAARRVLLRKG